jgi:hypothetical protein
LAEIITKPPSSDEQVQRVELARSISREPM